MFWKLLHGRIVSLFRAPPDLRIPFEFAREIRRANGDPVEPRALAKAFRARKLPSVEVIALEELLPVGSEEERWASALRVAVEDIRSVTAKTPGGTPVAGIVILSAVATVAVLVLIAHSAAKSEPTGCEGPTPTTWASAGAHLTTRPFDRAPGPSRSGAPPTPGPPRADPSSRRCGSGRTPNASCAR